MPASRAFATSEQLYVNVVPIDGGQFQLPLLIEVNARSQVFTMHRRIRDVLRGAEDIGEFFRSSLRVLPLPAAPTIRELEQENMADLYVNASLTARDLPRDEMATFFSRFDLGEQQGSEQYIHFLVWLPPADGKFPYLHAHNN